MRKTLTLIFLRVSRLWKVMLLIGGVATGLAWTWWHFDFLEMGDDERNAYDDGLKKFNNKWWFPWGRADLNEDIVLVAIDDDTFADVAAFEPWRDRYGSWPYDRVIWSDVLEALSEAGARQVVMDVTLAEPKSDITGDLKLGQTLGEVKVPTMMGFKAIARLQPLPQVKAVRRVHVRRAPPAQAVAAADAGAEEFPDEFPEEPDPAVVAKAKAEAAEKLRAHAAMAYAFPIRFEGGLAAATFSAEPGLQLADGGSPTGQDVHRDAGLITVDLPRYPEPAIEPVLDPMTGFGVVELEADEDGKMRTTQFVYTDGVNSYVTLPVAVAADLYGATEIVMEPGLMRIGDHTVRINPDGSAGLNYKGRMKQRFRTVSLSDVLRYHGSDDAALREEAKARFKDKIVFIGGTSQGAADQKPTPFDPAEAGVMKHMTALDNIMNNRFILEAPLWVSVLVALFVALLSVSLVLVVQSVVTDIGAPIFLYFFFFIITGGFLALTHWHVLSAMPSMAGTLAAVAATGFNRFIASKDREFMKQAFASYMEEDLLEQMVEGHRLPSLDGEDREVTAFFSDIRGFSTFSEQLKDQPKKLMALLNRYLSTVTPLIKAEGACIDKYIGDSVVALFGAPVSHEDHALRACRAALTVQTAVGELRKKLAAEGLPDVYTRIGLNTDHMLVGNIGSDELLDYTALGDGMNLASRLEGANKAFETLILIGPKTYAAVKEHVVARELDLVRVAGKHEPIAVYELNGLKGQVGAERLKVLELYGKALELYRFRRFSDALKVLKEAYDLDHADGPVRVLAAKCNRFMQHPPPNDWDTVSQLEK